MTTTNISTTIFTKLANSSSVQTASGISKMLSTKNKKLSTSKGSLAERVSAKPQHEKKGTLAFRIMQIVQKNKNGVSFDKIVSDITRHRPINYNNFSYTVKRSLAQLINWKIVGISSKGDSAMTFSVRKNSR